MRVKECLTGLIDAIQESEEYVRLQKAERSLAGYPELKAQMDEFRRMNYQLQNQDGVDLFDETDRLKEAYQKMRENPLTREYLTAELKVCQMVQNIYRDLLSSIELDIGFLDNPDL